MYPIYETQVQVCYCFYPEQETHLTQETPVWSH